MSTATKGEVLQERFEASVHVLALCPSEFTQCDYDYADEAQAEAEQLLEALNSISEYREPRVYFNMLEDVVHVLEDLGAHL